MDEEIKERVSTLEVVLGEFIVQINKALKRMEADTRAINDRMEADTKAMKEDTKAMKEDTKAMIDRMEASDQAMKEDTKVMKEDTKAMIDRMEADTKAMKERMDEDTRVMKKEMNQRWGELANRLGTLAEDIAAPNLPTVAANYFQCEEFDTRAVNAYRRNVKDRTVATEFDVVMTCQQTLFICEVKSMAKKEYVDMFREKLRDIFDYFPEHQGKTVIPIMAALNLHESVLNYLTKHKIYAMAMGGETMDLVNYNDIQAKK